MYIVNKKQIKKVGCGKKFNMNSSSGFICGVANAWGYEKLCEGCKKILKNLK